MLIEREGKKNIVYVGFEDPFIEKQEAYVDFEREKVYFSSVPLKSTIMLLCERFDVEYIKANNFERTVFIDFDWITSLPGSEERDYTRFYENKKRAIDIALRIKADRSKLTV